MRHAPIIRSLAAALFTAAVLAPMAHAQPEEPLITQSELDMLIEVLELQNQGEDMEALDRLEDAGMSLSTFQRRIGDLAYLAALSRLRDFQEQLDEGIAAESIERTLAEVREDAQAHFAEHDVPAERWEASLELVGPRVDQLERVLDADLQLVDEEVIEDEGGGSQ